MATHSLASCIFCKIIKGEIPSFKLIDNEHVLAFLDIGPLAKGHSLIIPKYHAAKLHQLPDEALTELLPAAKKVALALGAEDYNVLQNNGRIAHQIVDHVHFHVIPKPDKNQGLGILWPAQEDTPKDELAKLCEELKTKL